MFKVIAIALLLVAAAVADKDATVLKNEFNINPEDGSYNYAYETSNGIKANEGGVGGVKVEGGAEYEVDGQKVLFTYIADENGFQPTGDHIPKIPDLIARALEYIRTHTPHDGPSLKV
ncbi:pupal cuticle protein-like [Culicoides brevitarsis]|uniref:pupal cuticle protein-like n=1 Tax=Culicoides brevitarsis TaxID=469753 RepID=UPI00307BA1F7